MRLGQYRREARDNADAVECDKECGPHQKPGMDNMHPDYEKWNVESQIYDRQSKDVFMHGDFEMLSPEDEGSIAYLRTV